jgi:hypothetical protein
VTARRRTVREWRWQALLCAALLLGGAPAAASAAGSNVLPNPDLDDSTAGWTTFNLAAGRRCAR